MERAETAERPAETAARPKLHRHGDYAPPPFLVDLVELVFDLEADRTGVESRLTIRRAPETPANVPLRLDGRDLELLSLRVDGAPVDHGQVEIDGEGLTIAAPSDEFTLEIVNAIAPAKNTTRQGLFDLKGQLA